MLLYSKPFIVCIILSFTYVYSTFTVLLLLRRAIYVSGVGKLKLQVIEHAKIVSRRVMLLLFECKLLINNKIILYYYFSHYFNYILRTKNSTLLKNQQMYLRHT